MNLVIDDAIEVKQPTKLDPSESRKPLGKKTCASEKQAADRAIGQILLKGDNVSLIQNLS